MEKISNNGAGQTAFHKHKDAKTQLSMKEPSTFEVETFPAKSRGPASSRRASDKAHDEEKTDYTQEVKLILTISTRKMSPTTDSQACAEELSKDQLDLFHWPAENEDEECVGNQAKLMDCCEAEADVYRSTYDMVMNGLAEWKVKSEELQRENENFRILAASAEQTKKHLLKWKDEAERVQDEAKALQILAATVDQLVQMWEHRMHALEKDNQSMREESVKAAEESQKFKRLLDNSKQHEKDMALGFETALEQTKMWKNVSDLLMEENKNLHHEVEDLNKRVADLALLVKETEQRERRVSLKLQEVEKQSDTWKAKVQQLMVNNARLQAQLHESTRKVTHLELELEKSRQQEKNIASDFGKVVEEANIREKENNSLLNLNKDIQRQLQDSIEKISELEFALKESRQREEELSSALEKAVEQSRMQKKETDSLSKRKRAFSRQAQDSNKKIADLNLALGKLRQREQELSSNLNKEVEKTEIWEKERASLLKTNESLQRQLQEKTGKEKELYSTLKQSQQREKELSSALEKALQQKINLENWFSSLLVANKTLRKQQQELTSKIEEHNLALENSQQQEQRLSFALQKVLDLLNVWILTIVREPRKNPCFWTVVRALIFLEGEISAVKEGRFEDVELLPDNLSMFNGFCGENGSLYETESEVAEDDFFDSDEVQFDEEYSNSYDDGGELFGEDSQNKQYNPNEVTEDNFATGNDDVHYELCYPEYVTDDYSPVDDDEEQYDTDQSHYELLRKKRIAAIKQCEYKRRNRIR